MKFKRAIALIMIFAVVFSLSACGSKKESDSKTLVIAIQDEIEGTDIQQIGWDSPSTISRATSKRSPE